MLVQLRIVATPLAGFRHWISSIESSHGFPEALSPEEGLTALACIFYYVCVCICIWGVAIRIDTAGPLYFLLYVCVCVCIWGVAARVDTVGPLSLGGTK